MTKHLDVPTPTEAWQRLEPSFRGAVIATLQKEEVQCVASLQATVGRSVKGSGLGGDPDVTELAVRMARLADAISVAVKILQEAR